MTQDMHIQYIDADAGLQRVGNNETLYKKLLAKFEASVNIADFESALETLDYTRAGEIVHAAKGIAGNLSLVAFYDNSILLMDQFRGGGVPSRENTDAFIRLYTETVHAINEYIV